MSYSYEVNVICDSCGAAIAGETKESALLAEQDADRAASSKIWFLGGQAHHLCDKCRQTQPDTLKWVGP